MASLWHSHRSRHRSWRPQWFLWDPAGLMIASFAWIVMSFCCYALLQFIHEWVGALSLIGALNELLIGLLFGLCMVCHFRIMTTNPGTVPRDAMPLSNSSKAVNNSNRPSARLTLSDEDGRNTSVISSGSSIKQVNTRGREVQQHEEDEEEEEELLMSEYDLENQVDDGSILVFCDQCDIYRPARANHCATCSHCIILPDHHCPWVNNCIGIGNQKLFLLLLLYVCLISYYSLAVVLLRFATCTGAKCGFEPGMTPGSVGVWLLAAGFIFGLFCSMMLGLEVYSICYDTIFTTISEQITSRSGCKSHSVCERHLSVIFGTNGFDGSWLLPFVHRRNRHDMEVLFGCRRRNHHPSALEIC